jgi:hypothetical protein
MATRTHTYRSKPLRVIWIKKRDEFIERITPRPCMVVSVGLILAGISIPGMMAAGILPVSLLLGFVGFILAATGGVLALVFCGEI